MQSENTFTVFASKIFLCKQSSEAGAFEESVHSQWCFTQVSLQLLIKQSKTKGHLKKNNINIFVNVI